MLNLFYIEDHKDECKPFIDVIQLAGAARLIDTHVECVHGLDALGAGPLCDAILLDAELGKGIQHTLGWVMANWERMPPIIMVTNHVGYEADFLRAGAQRFWHKPDVIQHPQIFVDSVNQVVIRCRFHRPL